MGEADLMREIQIEASRLGWRLFRNNVGTAQGRNGEWIRFGLCTGSSDLIGWRPLVITQDMVGRTVAQFVGAEIKTTTGRASKEQLAFIAAVNQAGGLAALCRSVQDLKKIAGE